MKHYRLLLLTLMVTFITAAASAATIMYPLDYPDQYEREIGPELLYEHSVVEHLIENVWDPTRWKEWYVEIWVADLPEIDDIEFIDVDYRSPLLGDPFWIYNVPVTALDRPSPFPAEFGPFKGFYADSEELGLSTTPVNSGGPYPFGNPEWISFHFIIDVPEEDPYGWFLYDKCIPEPTSLILLGLGGLALIRKRKA